MARKFLSKFIKTSYLFTRNANNFKTLGEKKSFISKISVNVLKEKWENYILQFIPHTKMNSK